MPQKFEVDNKAPYVVSGVVINIETQSGKAINIKRIYIVDNESDFSKEKE